MGEAPGEQEDLQGLPFVGPAGKLLDNMLAALGLEVFVGNVAYFNTHSYTPFQLVDYLDDNINVGRGVGTISLDEGRTYLRFLDIDQPIYNLRFDGLVSDDTEPLHADSAVIFTIEGTDAANTELPGVVKIFDDSQVTIDFNHPLAGKALTFDVEIIEVKAL